MMKETIITFFAVGLLDLVFAMYTKAVADGRITKSSLSAALIYFLNAFVLVGIVSNNFLVIPACFGAFAGTYISVKWKL